MLVLLQVLEYPQMDITLFTLIVVTSTSTASGGLGLAGRSRV